MKKTIDSTMLTMGMLDAFLSSPSISAGILAALDAAPAVEPAQAVPEGYRLQSIAELDAMNEWIYLNDDLTIAYMSGRNDQKAVDHYNKQKALDFVRWIAQLKTGGLIQARANDILRILEKWK